MASKEGSSYQSASRLWNSETNSSNAAKAKKIFENQVPGVYVQDAPGNVYLCTMYKTARGEPVWQRIDDTTQKPVGKYIFINTGDSGTKPVSRTFGGTSVTYSIDGITRRLTGYTQVYSKKIFGAYIFMALSEGETEVAPSSSTGTVSTGSTSFTGTINSRVSDDSSLATSIINAKKNLQKTYQILKKDTNGKSGSGSVQTTTTPQGPSLLGAGVFKPGNSSNGSSNPSSKSPRGTNGPGAGGGANSPGGSPNSPNLPTVVVTISQREIYNGRDSYSGYADKPHIQQIITNFDPIKNERQRIIRRHIFDIIPNSFEFSQLSSTWNEVERSGNFPMVDWSKYNLTKCSFRFLVASTRIDEINSVKTQVNDGMDTSVDAEIENIRAIAGAPFPVIFNNLNRLISTSYRFPYLENTRGIQWVVADLSITATRLTPNGRGIAAAEVSITLNEYPVIARDIVRLPALAPYNPTPKQCKPKPCTPTDPRDNLFTDGYELKPESITVPEAKS